MSLDMAASAAAAWTLSGANDPGLRLKTSEVSSSGLSGLRTAAPIARPMRLLRNWRRVTNCGIATGLLHKLESPTFSRPLFENRVSGAAARG